MVTLTLRNTQSGGGNRKHVGKISNVDQNMKEQIIQPRVPGGLSQCSWNTRRGDVQKPWVDNQRSFDDTGQGARKRVNHQDQG